MTMTACGSTVNIGQERTRFFPRQLVAPADLTQDQIYFREKTRRHNRMLHGWGIVCGAGVTQGTANCEVVVAPGYILGPYGDEIVIDSAITVNLCTQTPDGTTVAPCADVSDPWCSQVSVSRQAGQMLYLAICYSECQARPVRVANTTCGCDDTACEYSRIRDSYTIQVLTTLPTSYTNMTQQTPEQMLQQETLRSCANNLACPPCPTEPWVILADITLNSDTSIQNIDILTHRRYVLSYASLYYTCGKGTT